MTRARSTITIVLKSATIAMTLSNNSISRANKRFSPTRPSSSSSSSSFSAHRHRNHDNEDAQVVDLVKLKERFDKQLPKYGFLWRSMANARLPKDAAVKGGGAYGEKENVNPPSPSQWQQAAADDDSSVGVGQLGTIDGNDGGGEESSTTPTSLLDAILNKQPVSLRVASKSSPNHGLCLCGAECDCADPIIEIIDNEDASVFDVNVDEELADSTDDESVMNSRRTAFKLEDNVDGAGSLDHEKIAAHEEESDDDESVVLLTRTPKKKMFIIDSDEEDGSDELNNGNDSSVIEDDHQQNDLDDPENGRGGDNNDESSKSISTYGISSTSSRRTSNRLRVSIPTSEDLDFIDSDGDESEKEWLEISSSEEEDNVSPPKRPNTIVILSDDEEETESEDDEDEQSEFTISDDSDSSAGSDYSSIHKTRGRGSPPRPTSGGRRATRKTITRENPSKSNTIPKGRTMSNKSQHNNSKSTFRKDRNAITSRTFSEFNKLAFNSKLSSVEVNWSNKLNTTAGITRMRGKLGEKNAHTRVATIELATKVIDDEDRLRATLLHEMCHAAQWLVDGVHKPPHGSHFKKWAALSTRVIGDVEVTTTHDYQIVYKYAWACTASNCKVVIKRHSRSVDPTKHCCGRCQGKLVEIEVPGSKGDTAIGTSYTEKKARKTSDFALFVKEKTPHVRTRLARELSCSPKEVAQSDVMKECGRLWRSQKDAAESSVNVGRDVESVEEQLANMAL